MRDLPNNGRADVIKYVEQNQRISNEKKKEDISILRGGFLLTSDDEGRKREMLVDERSWDDEDRFKEVFDMSLYEDWDVIDDGPGSMIWKIVFIIRAVYEIIFLFKKLRSS